MMMIINTLASQNLLNFHPTIKQMIHIKHPLFYVQLAYYRIFSQRFIDDGTNLKCLYTENKSFSDTQPNTTPSLVYSNIRICLPFRPFETAFNNLHAHCHTDTKITYNTFSQYYYIPFLEKWLSIFIHDCLECQRKKHLSMKINTSPLQFFSEHAPFFNYRISIDTRNLITPTSQNKSYIQVIVDAFSLFVVTVPIKSNNANTAIKTLLHHWIVKCGPPIYRVTDRGSVYINTDMAHFVHLWVLDILLEHLASLGLKD